MTPYPITDTLTAYATTYTIAMTQTASVNRYLTESQMATSQREIDDIMRRFRSRDYESANTHLELRDYLRNAKREAIRVARLLAVPRRRIETPPARRAPPVLPMRHLVHRMRGELGR